MSWFLLFNFQQNISGPTEMSNLLNCWYKCSLFSAKTLGKICLGYTHLNHNTVWTVQFCHIHVIYHLKEERQLYYILKKLGNIAKIYLPHSANNKSVEFKDAENLPKECVVFIHSITIPFLHASLQINVTSCINCLHWTHNTYSAIC